MKKSTLKQIIREELNSILNEATDKIGYIVKFKSEYTDTNDETPQSIAIIMNNNERKRISQWAAVDNVLGLGKKDKFNTSELIKHGASEMTFDEAMKYIKGLSKVRLYR